MRTIKVLDKEFETFITKDKIQQAIAAVAEKMNNDLKDKDPIFLAILNGSFLFAADLMKKVTIESEITFIKVASYHGGISTTGIVKNLIGIDKPISGRTVVILEDIVDTGITLEKIVAELTPMNPKEILTATMLYKPEAYTKDIKIDYIGLVVPNAFLLGYGLDYNGKGRNLEDIYVLKNNH